MQQQRTWETDLSVQLSPREASCFLGKCILIVLLQRPTAVLQGQGLQPRLQNSGVNQKTIRTDK